MEEFNISLVTATWGLTLFVLAYGMGPSTFSFLPSPPLAPPLETSLSVCKLVRIIIKIFLLIPINSVPRSLARNGIDRPVAHLHNRIVTLRHLPNSSHLREEHWYNFGIQVLCWICRKSRIGYWWCFGEFKDYFLRERRQKLMNPWGV